MHDIPGLVRWVYELAGARLDYPPLVTTLAELLLGTGSVRRAPMGYLPAGVRAKLRRAERMPLFPSLLGGEPVEILYRRGMTEEKVGEAVGHELSEHLLGREGYASEEIESLADLCAWNLIAPDPCVRLSFAAFGFDYAGIGAELGLPELAVAVRVAEACDLPTALVGRRQTWFVGEWGWPRHQELHAMAREKQLPSSVETVKLAHRPQLLALVMRRD